MLNAVGIGLMMPVMPELMLELTDDGGIGTAAAWSGAVMTSYALMQFLFSPTLGNLSDAFGRRPILLGSLMVVTFDYLMMALAPTLALFFLARVIAGAASATFSTANAFIADISTPATRAQNFGLTGAAFGVGFVVGPAIGGLLGEFGTRAPFWAAAALTLCNLALGWLVLPESLPRERRRPFRWTRGNPAGAAIAMAKRPAVSWLLVALFVYSLAHYVYPAILSFYAMARFGWSALEIGLMLAFVGVGFVIVQGFLIRRILPRFGAARTAVAALTLDAVSLIGLAIATEGWMAYALVPVASLSALFTPAVQGLMANRTPDDAQGELQGAVSALTSLAFAVTPILASQIFFYFTGPEAPVYFPGAPFVLAACCSALAILPFMIGQRRN
ncbi:TCR/Tet family MFS transporter [Pikeienuella piscinae]|uniref:TCR/Tet family MFS transporter n=2 Tax=Pikeienuella piscinae TaxID=2748098 RepID=A0A7M3T6U8_9RHOB|nr:TCR/Tet family MFS transporter [Pikeienuella piscinae]